MYTPKWVKAILPASRRALLLERRRLASKPSNLHHAVAVWWNLIGALHLHGHHHGMFLVVKSDQGQAWDAALYQSMLPM